MNFLIKKQKKIEKVGIINLLVKCHVRLSSTNTDDGVFAECLLRVTRQKGYRSTGVITRDTCPPCYRVSDLLYAEIAFGRSCFPFLVVRFNVKISCSIVFPVATDISLLESSVISFTEYNFLQLQEMWHPSMTMTTCCRITPLATLTGRLYA